MKQKKNSRSCLHFIGITIISTCMVIGLGYFAFQQMTKSRTINQVQSALNDGVAVNRDLAYTSDPHNRQHLDLYTPTSDLPAPVIIWLPGGGWMTGDKSNMQLAQFVNDGWAVASVNYRHAHQARFPAQVLDVKQAIIWLRESAETYNLDPSRFVVMGHSSGGHIAALVALTDGVTELSIVDANTSTAVQGAVLLSTPFDLTLLDDHAKETNGIAQHEGWFASETILLGCPVSQCAGSASFASPLTHIDASDPPLYIQHGGEDALISVRQAALASQHLEDLGHPHDVEILDDMGHALAFTPRLAEFLHTLR